MVEQGRKAAVASGHKRIRFGHIVDPDSWAPDDTYDAVVCSSVLEYVPNDELLLQQLGKALVPGGHLFISVPTDSSLVGKLEDLIGRLKNKNRDVEYAQRRYDIKRFGNSLSNAGMSLANCTYFEFPRLGSLGIKLSRNSRVGVMGLVKAQKN